MTYADGVEIAGYLFVAWATGFGGGHMWKLMRQTMEAAR